MKQYLIDFFTTQNFPMEATLDFLSCYDDILKNAQAKVFFDEAIELYNKSYNCDFNYICNEIPKKIEQVSKITPLKSSFILCVALTKKLKEYYALKGYDLAIYYDSIKCFKFKINEYYPRAKVYGFNNPIWFSKFLALERFGFGEFQFNLSYFGETQGVTIEEYHENGIDLYPDTQIISIHIPKSNVKITTQNLKESCDRACEFFKQFLPSGPIVIQCKSWLTNKEHLKILKPTSSIVQLINFFTIIEEGFYADYSELRRVFDTEDLLDVSKLPAQTTIQRHYINVIKNNKKVGWSRGLYVYKNN